jgi:hypothetical protein
MVLGHGGLPFIQRGRIFIKPPTKVAMRGSVFLSPTCAGVQSFFTSINFFICHTHLLSRFVILLLTLDKNHMNSKPVTIA